MASKFLTNEQSGNSLAERVTALAKSGAKFDFLVGYFFFSGFCEICKDLEEKPLRILIGMDAEVDVNNCICEFAKVSGENSTAPSKVSIRNRFFETLKNAIDKADVLDSAEFESSYRLFVKKLESGTLEVRKTEEPNHAKMYLFYLPPGATASGLDESKVIVGSSNFSLQGLRARNEVNVYLQDSHDFEDGKRIFEKLWETSVPLVSKENKDEWTRVLAQTWLEFRPTPYWMYVRALQEYFKVSDCDVKTPRELTRDKGNEFFDVSYQVDAIRDGVAKIKKHSGVIVADVVGLGKSVIASAIAANLDKLTIVISPPHLKGQWEEYISDFGLRGGRVYTSGKIEEAANDYENFSELVVIVDEAHRYRNEDTEQYDNLHRLCFGAGRYVILLSATPFNNRPEDIFSLIKLFQIPANSSIRTVDDLGGQMQELVKEYKKIKKERGENQGDEDLFKEKSSKLAQRIREILDPVLIRRTRIDLEKMEQYRKDLKAQGIQFSTVNPPVSRQYDLGALSGLYVETLERLTDEEHGFKGARYKPLTYLKNVSGVIDGKLLKKYAKYFDDVGNFQTGQRNMAGFMKQLLVRRFESSKYSFIRSLENIIDSMKILRKWFIEKHKIPMAKNAKLPDIDELDMTMGDDPNGIPAIEEALKGKNVWFIDAEDVSPEFLKELDSDISLLNGFLSEWNKTVEDPKLESIQKNLRESLKKEPDRKIIVFSEFSDTADCLAEAFQKSGLNVMKYSSKVATTENRELLRRNFDAGIPKEKWRDDFDILVATDAISEGFSLHRAGTIYNYDIPYNPTRVIQRVGRINRINKKVFDELFIYNFFPTATGEEVSHTAEISTFKMKLFQAILGADTKILTDDESIDGYLGKEFFEAENESDAVSWDVEFKNELYRIQKQNPDAWQKAQEIPPKCRISRSGKHLKLAVGAEGFLGDLQNRGVLLFSRKGDSFRFCFASGDGRVSLLSPEAALNSFKASKSEKGGDVSPDFYPLFEKARFENGGKETRQNSKTIQEALNVLNMLGQRSKEKGDREYLDSLRKIVQWDSVSLFALKKIASVNPTKEDALEKIREAVPESVMEAVLEKNSHVGCERETVLLVEEFR